MDNLLDNSLDSSLETFLAECQKRHTAELAKHVRRGMEQAVKDGRPVSLAPLGYRHGIDRTGGKAVVFDDQAPLVKRAWELAGQGRPLGAILTELNQQGLTGRRGGPLTLASLHAVLTNPFYAGIISYKGKLHRGEHTALISQAMFDRVQRIFRRSRRD